MVNVYLFIELLRAANAADTVDKLKALDLGDCKFANVVVLADDKLVAQLDCKTTVRGQHGHPREDLSGRRRRADQHYRRRATGA